MNIKFYISALKEFKTSFQGFKCVLGKIVDCWVSSSYKLSSMCVCVCIISCPHILFLSVQRSDSMSHVNCDNPCSGSGQRSALRRWVHHMVQNLQTLPDCQKQSLIVFTLMLNWVRHDGVYQRLHVNQVLQTRNPSQGRNFIKLEWYWFLKLLK